MISGSCSIRIPNRRILPLFGGQSDAWSGRLGVFWPQTARTQLVVSVVVFSGLAAKDVAKPEALVDFSEFV